MTEPRRDPIRTLLSLLFLALLLAAGIRVLEPFLRAALWATMIVVVTWPLLLWLQKRLWNRRWVAVTALTVGILLLVVAPLMLAIGAAIANADQIADQAKSLLQWRLPPVPEWIASLPVVGGEIAGYWRQFAAEGLAGLWARLSPYTGVVTGKLLAEVGDFGTILVQFVLTLIFAALMYLEGEIAAHTARRIGQRLGGRQGVAAVELTTQAIRGVALGVGGTAAVQAVLAGIGLAIVGLPYAVLLGGICFVLCIVQIGTLLVMVPAVAWLYWDGSSGWATFLLVWTLVLSTLDNVLRPVLIQRGVDLPFLLVFTGVVGGLLAFGLVGIFLGPVVLAVAHMLLKRWIDGPPESAAEAGADAGPEPRGD